MDFRFGRRRSKGGGQKIKVAPYLVKCLAIIGPDRGYRPCVIRCDLLEHLKDSSVTGYRKGKEVGITTIEIGSHTAPVKVIDDFPVFFKVRLEAGCQGEWRN